MRVSLFYRLLSVRKLAILILSKIIFELAKSILQVQENPIFIYHVEPPPQVSEEVREVLMASRPSYEGDTWVPAKLSGAKFCRIKREMIRAGHYFPTLPMRDRMLDVMPKIQAHVLAKEERWVLAVNLFHSLISIYSSLQCLVFL